MKIVFYRSLIGHAQNLTANERIMYSFLASEAVRDKLSDEFGFINKYELEELVFKYKERLPLPKVSYKYLSEALNISYQSAINGYKALKEHNFIDANNRIYIGLKLFQMGYFEIPRTYDIKGEALLLYAFLRDKAAMNDGIVSEYRSNIAAQFGVKEAMIKQLLSKLYKYNYIERLENGKLKIN